MSDAKQDEALNVPSGKASAVMRALHHSVVLKRELSRKAKLSARKSIFVHIPTYGHEPWVITERVSTNASTRNEIFTKNQLQLYTMAILSYDV